jgi:hypothetical protein
MKDLCDYIIANVDFKIDENISMQQFSYDELYDLDDCVSCISQCLDIDESAINVNKENLFIQRQTVISLKYKNRICEFYEHYGTQRDYIGVRLMPVS